MKHLSIIFLCAIFASCANNLHDLEKLKQEIISTDKSASELAKKEGFNTALLKYAGDSFVKLGEGAYPIIGKADFQKQMEGNPGTKSLTWEPVKAEVAQSGELGYSWGNWKLSKEDTTYYGNYFSVWKKHKDGTWKLELDGGNSTPIPK